MAISLERIDSAPILYGDFDNQLLQWLAGFIDSHNEVINSVEGALNVLLAPSVAFSTETVTLTSGSPSFTVADGSIYKVKYNVFGTGIPNNANIASISGNTITLNANATASGAESVTFVPIQNTLSNGVLLYDKTQNVYVGKANNALVKFSTTPYP